MANRTLVDGEAMRKVQMMEALKAEVTGWLQSLNPSAGLETETVIVNCEKLLATFSEQPAVKYLASPP